MKRNWIIAMVLIGLNVQAASVVDLQAGGLFVPTPTVSSNAATKAYVDAATNGIISLPGTLTNNATVSGTLPNIVASNMLTKTFFQAYLAGASNTPSAAWGVIPFDTEEYDYGSNFTAPTYTTPSAGLYMFSVHVG
jgi:hypothetical protein